MDGEGMNAEEITSKSQCKRIWSLTETDVLLYPFLYPLFLSMYVYNNN